MIFNQIQGDLFKTSNEYALAHCISLDIKMGAGIAKTFRDKYPGMAPFLMGYVRRYNMTYPSCVWYNTGDRKVFNLITKDKYWNKPTYFTLTCSLLSMRKQCLDLGITKVAMPLIGCGLDKLRWGKVKKIIMETFEDTDIEILICIR